MKYYLKALKNYANFKGRSTRTEYWYFVLFHIFFLILMEFISFTFAFPEAVTIYLVLTIVPTFAAGVRRIHDVGKSGWFVLVPIYNLILYLTPSNNNENIYGATTLN
jgi:uncharacterized membrane protein YhaH (DUF805 family)